LLTIVIELSIAAVNLPPACAKSPTAIVKDSYHCFEVSAKFLTVVVKLLRFFSVGAKLMTTDVKIPNDIVKLSKLGYHSYKVAMFL
jgi:hypothetical protein